MTQYKITAEATATVEEKDARRAVDVFRSRVGRSTLEFTVTSVEEIVPQPPLTRRLTDDEWREGRDLPADEPDPYGGDYSRSVFGRCTYARDGVVCGKPEGDLTVHARPDDRMGHGKHVFRVEVSTRG